MQGRHIPALGPGIIALFCVVLPLAGCLSSHPGHPTPPIEAFDAIYTVFAPPHTTSHDETVGVHLRAGTFLDADGKVRAAYILTMDGPGRPQQALNASFSPLRTRSCLGAHTLGDGNTSCTGERYVWTPLDKQTSTLAQVGLSLRAPDHLAWEGHWVVTYEPGSRIEFADDKLAPTAVYAGTLTVDQVGGAAEPAPTTPRLLMQRIAYTSLGPLPALPPDRATPGSPGHTEAFFAPGAAKAVARANVSLDDAVSYLSTHDARARAMFRNGSSGPMAGVAEGIGVTLLNPPNASFDLYARDTPTVQLSISGCDAQGKATWLVTWGHRALRLGDAFLSEQLWATSPHCQPGPQPRCVNIATMLDVVPFQPVAWAAAKESHGATQHIRLWATDGRLNATMDGDTGLLTALEAPLGSTLDPVSNA